MTQAIRKTRKPYMLVFGGRHAGYYKTLQDAIKKGRSLNAIWIRSGAPEFVEQITITYDQAGETQRTVHEE
jgi:hypothetical protein